MNKGFAIFAFSLALTACASSPQQVKLQPQVEVNSRLAKQPAVNLTISDNRPSPSLGTRGGVYGGSNHITPARSLSDSIYPVASKALTELGARMNASSPFPVDLRLEVEQLSYTVDENSTLPLQVELKAAIRAVANKNGRSFSGRYESSKLHKFVTSPSEEKNEEVINDVLSTTLNRVFNDPKLLTFMEQ
ncbi:YajG family lipoprotein [Motiliproteus sediminis]|uniref:YajG family lipoprotein n=1 Tax=Motiliproteus sediminis TaxID=1468178 RepID=UPI001AEF6B25|nr:YajG family lipoprotein [Motiliproteus sediminis]